MKISTAQLWVHDQDEALAFYTEKLGFEVRSDVTLAEMGDFRWLTVSPPGQEDVAVVLMADRGEDPRQRLRRSTPASAAGSSMNIDERASLAAA